jgi:hypothetical protein
MDARLLAQLSYVALYDAERAVPDPYAWPPARRATRGERRERERLLAISEELHERAKALGFEGGSDAAFFGEEPDAASLPQR